MTPTDLSILLAGDPSGDAPRLATLLPTACERPRIIVSSALHDALARLEAQRFDLFFLDPSLANGGLRDLLARVRRGAHDAPAIVAINVPDEDTGRGLLRQGICDYLLRGCVERDAIARTVRFLADRRTLENALAVSEERYQRLLGSVTDYTYTVFLDDGRVIASRHSPGCTAVTGYCPADYEADPFLWFNMIHEDDRSAVVQMGAQVIAGATPPPLEHRIRHKDGSIRWIRNTVVPRRSQDNRLVAYDGLVTDVTERVRAERESEQQRQKEFSRLERAKREWEVTFDAISDPIFIHDDERRILRANRAYREIAGMAFRDLIGKPYDEVFPPLADSEERARFAASSADGGQPFYVEDRSAPGGTRIFRSRAYGLRDARDETACFVQVLEDVTEMKQAEERLRQERDISTNLLALAETASDTMDVNRLMERLAACCRSILGADTVLTYLWDGKSMVLRPCQQCDLAQDLFPRFRTDSLDLSADFARVALDGRHPLALRRAGDGSGFLPEPLGGQNAPEEPLPPAGPLAWNSASSTFLVVPLSGKTGNLGMLIGMYRENKRFGDRDRAIIDGIAREASLALDEACMSRTALERSMELAHKIETLKVIHEVDLTILSGLAPHKTLETAVRNISRIVSCDDAEALLFDPEARVFRRVAGAGRPGPDDGIPLPLGHTSAAAVLSSSRPHYLPDLRESALPLPEEARLVAAGYRSLMRVPLVVKGAATGVLSVVSRRHSAFSPADLDSLEQLAGLIGVAFENTRLITDLQELFLGTVKSLSFAIDAKSSWTAGHSERVTGYALLLGRELGLSDQRLHDLELAGLLHDVGKLGTYDAILDKKGVLTDQEYEIIKQHPLRGAELLAPIKQLKHIIPAVRHHHERFDGSGYPDGLRSGQIPDLARILAVADAFDSMTGWRPYRKTFNREEALTELKRCSGNQFDPELAEAFIAGLRRSPRLAA